MEKRDRGEGGDGGRERRRVRNKERVIEEGGERDRRGKKRGGGEGEGGNG